MGDSNNGCLDRWDLFKGLMRRKAESEARHRYRKGRIHYCEIDDFADCLQLRLLEAWDRFNPNRSDPGGYLHGVARREADKILRAKTCPYGRPIPPNIESPASDCADQVDPERADLVLAVRRIVDALPPCQRKFCELVPTNPKREAARKAGIPPGTLHTHIKNLRLVFGPLLGIRPQLSSQ